MWGHCDRGHKDGLGLGRTRSEGWGLGPKADRRGKVWGRERETGSKLCLPAPGTLLGIPLTLSLAPLAHLVP